MNSPAVDPIYRRGPDAIVVRFCYLMTHSGPTIPEAASSRSSVKDTLFLSKAESEQMEEGRGGVVALRAEP